MNASVERECATQKKLSQGEREFNRSDALGHRQYTEDQRALKFYFVEILECPNSHFIRENSIVENTKACPKQTTYQDALMTLVRS